MKKVTAAAGLGAALGATFLHFGAPAPLSAQRSWPASGAQRSPPAAATLCRAGEQALFQCRIGRRTVSLCAGQAGGEEYVQYRFGRPGRIELAYPERGKAGLSWARIGYSGGGEMQVNFDNEGHRYVLYSRMVRTRFDGVNNAPRFSAGVTVVRGNRIVADRACTDTDDPWIAEAPTERLLPEGQPTEWDELDE